MSETLSDKSGQFRRGASVSFESGSGNDPDEANQESQCRSYNFHTLRPRREGRSQRDRGVHFQVPCIVIQVGVKDEEGALSTLPWG